MKCFPARWGQSWITNNQGETSSDGKKQGQNCYQLTITFFVQGKQQKWKEGWGGGGKVFSFIVEKQLGSVFVGNWPRLQTSINQSHASVWNKDTAVVTLQHIHYFQTHALRADMTHHWLAAALPITWPPTVCSVVLSSAHGRWRASTSGSPLTVL